jgi:hypothetical protein
MQSTSSIDKLLDDSNFDPKTGYSYERLVNLLEEASKDVENLKPYEFLGGIYEFTRSFKKISSSLSMGFADITEKVGIWRDIFKKTFPEARTIQEVLKNESELNLQQLNGDNNSSLGHKKKTQWHGYVSGTRTLLRLTWFMKFMMTLLTKMIKTDDSFNKCIKQSYDEILAPKHTWLVRKAAGVGFSFAPSKKTAAYSVMFESEEENDETRKKVTHVIELLDKIYQHLHKWYEDKKLLDLP